MKYKITFERAKCIGAGACVTACSETWEMAPDNKANQKKKTCTDANFAANLKAAKVCPVNVIHIEDEKGKKLI